MTHIDLETILCYSHYTFEIFSIEINDKVSISLVSVLQYLSFYRSQESNTISLDVKTEELSRLKIQMQQLSEKREKLIESHQRKDLE